MKIKTIEVGLYEVNCTILNDDARAWIVDPGQDADTIAAYLNRQKLSPVAILLTHAHFDHIGAIPDLVKIFPEITVCVHPNDVPAFGNPMNQLPPDYPLVRRPKELADITKLPAALLPPGGFSVIETPGHTPGGVCYHFEDEALLLSGDTLFAGSVGRTDFPGGDMSALTASLAKLKTLPGTTTVIPGHGPKTTIAQELRSNPFLR